MARAWPQASKRLRFLKDVCIELYFSGPMATTVVAQPGVAQVAEAIQYRRSLDGR